MLARWTTDWDCADKTEWWYCIIDGHPALENMGRKQRYRINKGERLIEVSLEKAVGEKVATELYYCMVDAVSDYPSKYRPHVDKDGFVRDIMSTSSDIWICRDRSDGVLCGYGLCTIEDDWVGMNVIKTRPSYRKKEVNAILAWGIADYYLNKAGKRVVCDGERNISHETNYQEFLVHFLGFRYAYCRLHVVYSSWLRALVKILFPFRVIFRFGGRYSGMMHKIDSILKQEKIVRSFQ